MQCMLGKANIAVHLCIESSSDIRVRFKYEVRAGIALVETQNPRYIAIEGQETVTTFEATV